MSLAITNVFFGVAACTPHASRIDAQARTSGDRRRGRLAIPGSEIAGALSIATGERGAMGLFHPSSEASRFRE